MLRGYCVEIERRFSSFPSLHSNVIHLRNFSVNFSPKKFPRKRLVKSSTHYLPVRGSQSLTKQSTHGIDVQTWQSRYKRSGEDYSSMTSICNVPSHSRTYSEDKSSIADGYYSSQVSCSGVVNSAM